MQIKALDKSLIDWPGKISLMIWLGGCNLRCGYCQNPQLVENTEGLPTISEEEVFKKLENKKWYDCVVISGGEPTLNQDLPAFMKKIKDEGYATKIQTNGTNPSVLEHLIFENLVDAISMDIKWSLEKYDGLKENIQKSIKLLMKSSLEYEFCTTVVPGIIREQEIREICETIKGTKNYYLQQFQPKGPLLDKDYEKIEPYTKEELIGFWKIAKPYFEKCEIRGI